VQEQAVAFCTAQTEAAPVAEAFLYLLPYVSAMSLPAVEVMVSGRLFDGRLCLLLPCLYRVSAYIGRH
jgi:hypothetical protein